MTGRRHHRIGRAAAAVLCAVLAGGCDAGARASAVAEVGAPAPSYAARRLSGDSVSLASLRGDVVLLNVWATWCHPCRTEIPELETLHRALADSGLRVVGVSIDAAGEDSSVAGFAREYGMTYPVWRDADSRVTNLFAAIGVPATYLIDRDGVLRWKHVGPITASDPALRREIGAALQ